MLQRLYIHNFRCLENFELSLKGLSSVLLIGRNGSGKSTISRALEILQSIGRGVNRTSQLIHPTDFTRSQFTIPIRFEIEVLLEDKLYTYNLALELPDKFKESRVLEEQLTVASNVIYTRKNAQVNLYQNRQAQFLVDWHLVALPVIQAQSEVDPLYIFRTWLAQIVILAPIPSLINEESHSETLQLKPDASNFGEWSRGILSRYPAAYSTIEKYLQQIMPDISDFQNEHTGKDSRRMKIQFQTNNGVIPIYFDQLSDGEKCFFICAMVLAANKYYGPLFCFWDEPDNYLSLAEVGHFIVALRQSFKQGGQILVTSHNEETIRKFSPENTFVLDRKSHLEPTLVRLLSDVPIQGDLVDTLIRGDIEL